MVLAGVTVGKGSLLAVVIVLTVVLSYPFNPRKIIVRQAAELLPDATLSLGDVDVALRAGIWRSAIPMLFVFGVPLVLAADFPPGLDMAFGVVAVAVGKDLYDELAFRRRTGAVTVAIRLQRVCSADLAVEALRRESIPALARGLYHRTLMHFAGPYVPLEILVPKEKEEAALDVVFVPEDEGGTRP